jgi:alpha-tubulin suppressor-like RCC1 family protein
VRTPEKLPEALLTHDLTAIAAGEHHTLGKTAQNKVLAWGRPTYGRLGRTDVEVGSDSAHPDAAEVSAEAFDGQAVATVAAGVLF